MRLNRRLRRYWPEVLLVLALVLPWLSLLALGAVWLWEGGRFWVWAIAAAALGLLIWPHHLRTKNSIIKLNAEPAAAARAFS
jgi:hypothetical protein